MKRFALAAIGLVALLPAAIASDMPAPNRMPPAPARAPASLPFDWGGFHAGLNLGGGFGDVDGVIFGGQIGHNWQINQLVFGVETDIQFSGQDGTSTIVAGGTAVAIKQELDWFGTFRGRVGYAVWDRWLPYFTVGLAYGTRSGTVVGTAFSASDTSVGWTIGVGVDYAINQWWSARLEYLHVSLDGFTETVPGTTLAVSVGRFDNDIVRGAVNYKFMP